MKTTGKERTKKTNFSFSAPEAGYVFLVGDFNAWSTNSHPMKKDKKGAWKTSINLLPGTYQYRFLVDGCWQNDPSCAGCVPNEFGTLNCVMKVQ